jgi:nucleoside-diphosphate-sugar epimerase
MIRVGVLGASGFVGTRLTEIFHLERMAEVVPIVRSSNSLAGLARFALEWRIADALDYGALVEAFRGCDVIVHSIHGPNELLVEAPRVAYRAASRAGVRRIVYLSTAAVHGQDPAPGTDETSPLHTRHPVSYNNAKVRAEREFQRLRKGGNVEVVILRPPIVFGPRDGWVTSMAEAILARSAYVVRGEGICNTVYVDNLVHAIRLAMTADADGEVFIITDKESVTWSALYRRVSEALGNHWTVPVIEDPAVIRERLPILAKLKEFAPVGAAVPFIPRGWKIAARDASNVASVALSAARSAGRHQSVNPWQLPATPTPAVPLSVALLHRCRHKFSYAKAKDRMGYEPLLSLDEGLERTLAWMRFVAYPVGPRSITDPGRAVR